MLVDSLLKHNLEHLIIDLCQQLAENFEKSLKSSSHNKKLRDEEEQKKILANLLAFLVMCSLHKPIHFYTSLVSTIFEI